jgi:hypothetical protein
MTVKGIAGEGSLGGGRRGTGGRGLAGSQSGAYGGAGCGAIPAVLHLTISGAALSAAGGAYVTLLQTLHHSVAALRQPPNHLPEV